MPIVQINQVLKNLKSTIGLLNPLKTDKNMIKVWKKVGLIDLNTYCLKKIMNLTARKISESCVKANSLKNNIPT